MLDNIPNAILLQEIEERQKVSKPPQVAYFYLRFLGGKRRCRCSALAGLARRPTGLIGAVSWPEDAPQLSGARPIRVAIRPAIRLCPLRTPALSPKREERIELLLVIKHEVVVASYRRSRAPEKTLKEAPCSKIIVLITPSQRKLDTRPIVVKTRLKLCHEDRRRILLGCNPFNGTPPPAFIHRHRLELFRFACRVPTPAETRPIFRTAPGHRNRRSRALQLSLAGYPKRLSRKSFPARYSFSLRHFPSECNALFVELHLELRHDRHRPMDWDRTQSA